MRWQLGLIVLVGCGRVGFGPTPFDGRDGAIEVLPAFTPLSNPHALANVSVSGFDEYGPSLSSNELELYFTSNRSGMGQIYVATRAMVTDDFGPPVVVMWSGATSAGEATISRGTGLEAYVASGTRTRRTTRATLDPMGWSALVEDTSVAMFPGFDLGGSDLRAVMSNGQVHESVRTSIGAAWSAPRLLDDLVGYSPQQNYPTLTDDGLEIFFQAYPDTSQTTILTARRASFDEPFGPASPAFPGVPMGVSIGDPFISADGLTLYYNSSESDLGQSDLWVAYRERL